MDIVPLVPASYFHLINKIEIAFVTLFRFGPLSVRLFPVLFHSFIDRFFSYRHRAYRSI